MKTLVASITIVVKFTSVKVTMLMQQFLFGKALIAFITDIIINMIGIVCSFHVSLHIGNIRKLLFALWIQADCFSVCLFFLMLNTLMSFKVGFSSVAFITSINITLERFLSFM